MDCQDCGCKIIFDYAATHRSWNHIIGTKDNPCGEGVIFCINCFCIRAQAIGEHPYFTRMFVVNDRFSWDRGNETSVESQRAALDKLQRKYNSVKGDLLATKAALPVRLGPVVEIRLFNSNARWPELEPAIFCDSTCSLFSECNAKVKEDCFDPGYIPSPDCPRPAPKDHHWRLALFAKGEEEVGDEPDSE